MRDNWWFEEADAARMIESLRDWELTVSARKLRLFACACGRAELRGPGQLRRTVEVTERFADGNASDWDLLVAGYDGPEGDGSPFPYCIAHKDAVLAAWHTAKRPGISESRRKADADLLRCIGGDPRRKILLDPVLMPTVVALARAAYDERSMPSGELDPARLAVLADALEEAGCGDAKLLAHLRQPGLHVRGCFAVDALLGLG